MWWVQLATSTLPAASGSGHAGWAYTHPVDAEACRAVSLTCVIICTFRRYFGDYSTLLDKTYEGLQDGTI